MQSWFSILGRERQLAMAELAVVVKPSTPLEQHGAIAVGSGDMPTWERVGSTQRAGIVLGTCKSLDAATIMNLLDDLPTSGKIQLGVSVLGLKKKDYQRLAMQLKSVLKERGNSARIISSSDSTMLNAAQLIHNQLISSHGIELVIWEHHHTWWIGRTTWVQDIEAYTQRDRDRPARDARVGMLPPKLAQTLINLAQPEKSDMIYDPFCGTGVVLMEAALMGYNTGGSDISERMVEASRENMHWLQNIAPVSNEPEITAQDARSVTFPSKPGSRVCIVGEGYLGLPLGPEATQKEARAQIEELDRLYIDVLQNLSQQSCVRAIVLALPFWHIQDQEYQLNFLDSLDRIGYTFDQFAPHDTDRLTYRRVDQRVGRMIVRLVKKSEAKKES